jgi:hypothetical protein
MPSTKGTRTVYRCSFCGKSQAQVQRLIAGPNGVYICDGCVDLCRGIIEDEKTNQLETSESGTQRSGNPSSVRAFFANLPTASTSGQSDTLYPTVEVEFVGRFSQPQRVYLLGRDSTGIVVRDWEADSGGVHFYPWSSIFSLTP